MSFHLYRIDEIFSNADGTVQFIELHVGASNFESFWTNRSITVTSGGVTHTFTFGSDLPSTQTANTSVLIATQGFANLGLVTPNFIVPDGFLFTGGGTVNFADVDIVPYPALPTDGTHSVNDAGAVQTASPTNFAGATATMPTTITGTAGNDHISNVSGTATIDGAGGTDTVFLQASFASLTAVTASHVAGPGFDLQMTQVERVALDDRYLVFDTQHGEAAWELMAILCAGFGPTAGRVQLANWLGRQDLPDAMSGVAQAVIDQYAPGVGNAALVSYLYGSVAGISSPSAAQVDEFANQIGAGKTFATQGDLVAFVAGLSINTDKIADFVGIQQVLYA